MIRFAQEADLPALLQLWQEAFGDGSGEEASYYFARRHQPQHMLVALEKGRAAGMLTMLPVELAAPGSSFPARYIFAVATLKAFRGQGISTRLLEAAHSHMRQTGAAASLLVPATPSLFDFYGRRGYKAAFYLDSLVLSPGDFPPPDPAALVKDCAAADYLRLRDRAFSGSSLYARWDAAALSYVIEGFRREGGGALRIRLSKGEACCLYERRDGGVRVTELALAGLNWQGAMAAIHQRLNAPRYTLRMPQGTLPGADQMPFGMIRWFTDPPALSGGAPYLSLAKD